MDDVNAILKERLKKNESLSKKMDSLAERSNKGQLSSFAGVFKVIPLQDQEVAEIRNLVEFYRGNVQTTSGDLEELLSITSEVKAINSQAMAPFESARQAVNMSSKASFPSICLGRES